jgi:hypothetical protein
VRCRHAEAVRCTATYLDLRAAVEPAATPATAPHALLRVATVDHPARPTRGELGSSHAATLLTSCEVPVTCAATGWGGETLGSPPWLPSAPRRWLADGAGLASPRRRDQGGQCFIHRPGWMVFHLPPTLTYCEPFDSQPMAETEQRRPHYKRDVDRLDRGTERSDAISSSCPAASPASPPHPASSDPGIPP